MRNYFLASVGNAELFKKVDGELLHFASARTLTESSISFSVSAEEVRGGEGAQLLGQFFHTSNFGLQMTDAMFHLEYIAAQVGGEIENGGYGMVDEKIVIGDNDVVPALMEAAIPLVDGTKPVVWYNAPGDSEYATWVDEDYDPNAPTHSPQTIKIPGAKKGDEYCVHYFADKKSARKLIINSNFVPSELIVFLTTRLFAGDASAPETGKPVGSVTVKIPRFQLNGTADISMAMASAATVQMQGNALAYDAGCDGAKYAEIVEFLALGEYDQYVDSTNKGELVMLAGTNVDGHKPMLYAVKSGRTPLLMNILDTRFTFTYEGEEGKLNEKTGILEGTTIKEARFNFTKADGTPAELVFTTTGD